MNIIDKKRILIDASNGDLEVLKNEWVAVHVNLTDKNRTPLHLLALSGKIEVLSHPQVDKVRDNFGMTPLHWLSWKGKLTFEHLKVKYPRYPFKSGAKMTTNLVSEILSTSNAERFILDERNG